MLDVVAAQFSINSSSKFAVGSTPAIPIKCNPAPKGASAALLRKKKGSEREKTRAKKEREEKKENKISSDCYQTLSGNDQKKKLISFFVFSIFKNVFQFAAGFGDSAPLQG